MSATLLLALFFGSWIGFAIWAKTKKRWSGTIAIGGGFVFGCLALIALTLVAPGNRKDERDSSNTAMAATSPQSPEPESGRVTAIDGRCKRFSQMTPILFTQPIRRMERLDKAAAVEGLIAGGAYQVLSIYVNQHQTCMAKIQVSGVYDGTSFSYVLDGPLQDKDYNMGAD